MIRRLSRTLALMGAFSLVPLLSGCVGYDGYDGYYGGGGYGGSYYNTGWGGGGCLGGDQTWANPRLDPAVIAGT
ncbi:hypothetical protein JK184_08555, partial [Gluconobacter cerinus]|nr:hypothetical protein [Gluconobacter cerinus]